MYTEGSETTGHHRFLHYNNSHGHCPCQHCIYYEPPYEFRLDLGHHPAAAARQTDQSSLAGWRDIQAPRAKDVGGRALAAGRVSPQRRPVFVGPGSYSLVDDPSQVCPWELKPAQWGDPVEPRVRHYSFVREQCGCVVQSARARPLHSGIPHPLPHLQVKGQGYMRRRTVRYISVDEEEGCGCTAQSYHLDLHNNQSGHSPVTNGHGGPKRVVFEREEDGDHYPGRPKGGSEDVCNGCDGSDKAFFSTEVPQRHLSPRRRRESRIPPARITCSETSNPIADDHQQCQGSEVAKHSGRQDSVRDQIRQVVTDLEEVLGGLKQVHVEMKEVVDQIDRLTANIDLREEELCIAQEALSNFHDLTPSGGFRVAALPSPQPALSQDSLPDYDKCLILRTNSVSPVHMASVVKTSQFSPPSLHSDTKRLAANGHLPHLQSNHLSQVVPEHPPQTLDPKVIIANSTSNPRTQKPPPYPQNGRCGKGPYPQPKPVRTPAYPTKGRQSTSMV